MASPVATEVMDITTMLNKNAVHQQQQQQQQQHQHQHHPLSANFLNHQHTQFQLIKQEPGMERAVSPHSSESSVYSTSQGMSRAFPSPTAMQTSMHIQNPMSNAMQIPGFPDLHDMSAMPNMPLHHMSQQAQQQAHQQAHQQAPHQHMHQPAHQQPHPPPPQHPHRQRSHDSAKAFACCSCGKGFARRSDLSRHERIHSGHKPHVCEFRGCGKNFIQRSALTVHQRVHTGEKPHHCETCAKAFSDSSSLARHRRTHTGNRPYRCPYADCQKTFTRRTTLTRHQNHHTGTIEEAAVATAAALAASGRSSSSQPAHSDTGRLSNQASPLTTPSPAQRPMSMSPSIDLSGANDLARHSNDFNYIAQTNPLPPHLRVSSPATSTSSASYNPIRPTSHPTVYGPPNTLEPNLDQHQTGTSSASGSPHMSSVGWQSPSQVASPSHHAAANYVYQDATGYPPNSAAMGHMYYNAAPQMRRPQMPEHGLVQMA